MLGFIFVQKDVLIANAIEGLNTKLDAKVNVGGKIDMTFFSTFPSLTLEFKNVIIEDKFEPEKVLADLERVNFTINPFSLFGDQISFKNIILSDGKVNLKTYKDGKSNFDIIKKNEEKEDSTGISLDLEKILLNNIDLFYDDEKNAVFLDGLIVGASISGKFKDANFSLKIDLKSNIELLKVSDTEFLDRNLVSGKFELRYESENKCILFKNSEININDNLFNISGQLCSVTNTIDLIAKAKGKQIKNALQLIPKDLFNLDGISGNGKYEVEVFLNEKLNKPKIKVNFFLEDATAKVDGINLDFKEIYTKGSFSNSPRNNIVLKDFAFKTGQSHLKGNLFLPNLNEKQMQLKATGEIFSTELQQFNFGVIDFESDGKIVLNNLDLDFSYRKQDSVWLAKKLTGGIIFENLKGNLLEIDQKYSLNAKMNAVGKKINVENLQFNIGENDIQFSGSLDNALNYFQEDILKTNDALFVNGKVHSNHFDINLFLDKKAPSDEKKEEINLLKWLNINSNIDLSIGKMTYKKLLMSEVSARIKSNKAGTFNCNNLSANTLGGEAKGDVELRFLKDHTLEISLNSKIKNIDINKLFIALDDFDQKTITHANVKGKLSADLIVAMTFKNFVEFSSKDLLVNTSFVIDDGELINLKALEALSKYLSVEQLRHIYFSKYKSNLAIVNEVIYLDKNQIKSNLISLEIGGSHSFTNQIDYIIKLNLNNLLAAKFRKNKTLEEDYVNDVMGGLNLFISMKGNIDNPIIKLEKRSAFRDKVKEENENKETIKEEIKTYFKKDDPNKKEKKEFYFEKDKEEFIDFEE